MKKQTSNSTSIFAQIEKEVPKILAKVSKTSSDFLSNEQSQKNALVVGYEFLPLVIRLVISEDKFVNFCMEHKEKFFGKPKTATKKATAKTSIITKKIVPKKAITTTKKTTNSPKTTPKAVAKPIVAKPVSAKPKTTLSRVAVSKK
jgi:hypothetical protein